MNQPFSHSSLPSEHAVVQYLQQHPEFFERHAELFTLPHLRQIGAGQQVTSLVMRQFQQLRTENNQLKTRLQDVIARAREYRQQQLVLNDFLWQLARTDGLPQQIALIYQTLSAQFPHTSVRLCLATPQPLPVPEWVDEIALHPFKLLFQQANSVSGRPTLAQRQLLFGERPVASMTMTALIGQGWRGIVAVASEQETRFPPDHPPYFLQALAEHIVLAFDEPLQSSVVRACPQHP